MPLQEFTRGRGVRWDRLADLMSVEIVVVAAVLELVADTSTDAQFEPWRDRNVASVEERVQVGSEQQAVLGRVLS